MKKMDDNGDGVIQYEELFHAIQAPMAQCHVTARIIISLRAAQSSAMTLRTLVQAYKDYKRKGPAAFGPPTVHDPRKLVQRFSVAQGSVYARRAKEANKLHTQDFRVTRCN